MKFSKDRFMKDREDSYKRSRDGELDLLSNSSRKKKGRGNQWVR